MDMDVFADVVGDLNFAKPFMFARVATSRNRDGSLSKTETWVEVVGLIQPAQKSETKNLTEGDRTLPAIKVWCGQALNPTFGDLPQMGDLIDHNGRIYRVIDPHDWSQYHFWSAVAVEVRSG